MPPEASRIFHLAPPGAGPGTAGTPTWTPAAFADEGFIHFSSAAQLAGTLARHFADHAEVELVEVEIDAGDPALRWEPSRGGQDFPHLYRALARGECRRSWSLHREAGSWHLPHLGPHAGEDRPAGRPLQSP